MYAEILATILTAAITTSHKTVIRFVFDSVLSGWEDCGITEHSDQYVDYIRAVWDGWTISGTYRCLVLDYTYVRIVAPDGSVLEIIEQGDLGDKILVE